MIGIGAMMHYLGGGSERSPAEYVGRTIVAASMTEEECVLSFADGAQIAIVDTGQSCCEARYMTTDDDLNSLIGRKLLRIEAKDGPTEVGEYDDEHETCFVEIGTDTGFVTLVNHNEHNGYYGGFGLSVEERRPASAIEARQGEDAPAASCGARERGPEGETPNA